MHGFDDRRWFTGGADLDGSGFRFLNSHATQRANGTWAIDSFYSSLPRPEYQSDPQEVAWHYKRVKELRAQAVPQEQRIAILKTEAANKPWEKSVPLEQSGETAGGWLRKFIRLWPRATAKDATPASHEASTPRTSEQSF